MQTISAILEEFSEVMTMAHPIIPLSREKLFKEKSIDRRPVFFE
jgi:hypothetical protein